MKSLPILKYKHEAAWTVRFSFDASGRSSSDFSAGETLVSLPEHSDVAELC